MGQAVAMMATSLAERCHETVEQADRSRQSNHEKELVAGRTRTEETKAIEPCMTECVSAATGGCQEGDSARCDAEDEVRGEGIS